MSKTRTEVELWVEYQNGGSRLTRVVSEGQGVERPSWSSSRQTREKEIGNSEGGQQLGGVFGYREQKIGHVQ